MLATVLFTDIVGSSEKAAALGDRPWKELLSEHRALVRQQLCDEGTLSLDEGSDICIWSGGILVGN